MNHINQCGKSMQFMKRLLYLNIVIGIGFKVQFNQLTFVTFEQENCRDREEN